MKCPHCGAWNQAYLPKCVRCGAPLDGNTQTTKSWEADMHRKKPSLQVVQFEPGDSDVHLAAPDVPYDPEAVDGAALIVGMAQAWRGASLFKVAIACCATVYVLELFIL